MTGFEQFIDLLRSTVMITGFVFVMMLVIEYINVLTRGMFGKFLTGGLWRQYILAAFLGVIPGCLGSFAAVAMFSHRLIGLGALITAMVVTSGDETFVMLAMIPREAGLLIVSLFLIGIIAGPVTDLITRRSSWMEKFHCDDLSVHEEHAAECFPRGKLRKQWKNCSPARGILASVLALLLVAIISGQFTFHGHGHSGEHPLPEAVLEGTAGDAGEHGESSSPEGHYRSEDSRPGPAAREHEHAEESDGGGWGWIRITLLVTTVIALFIVVTVPDHFLEEHLWRHIALRHVPRIFLWTFGALAVIFVITSILDLDVGPFLSRGKWFVLAGACLAGLLPQSGPHLIFVTLFAGGYIPVSVLLANSIVQDGHGLLPLIAQSRRLFAVIKIIKLVFGLAVGAAAMAIGI